MAASLQFSSSAAEKREQWMQQLLMERIRSRASQQKSFSELSKSMRISMLTKRYALDAKEKSNLQNCLDSMQQRIGVTSRKLLVQRLENVSRQLGLRFTEDTTRLFISTDMFYLEIILDGSGALQDVKVHHECKIEQQSCSELLNCLRSGDFDDFLLQLQGLSSIYKLNAEAKVKKKAFVVLQAMETDLYNLSQAQNYSEDIQELLNSSSVGLVRRRRGGHPMKLTYFVAPYDLIFLTDICLQPLILDLISTKDIGMSVTLNLEAASANKLQVMPTITFVKDSNTGVETPVYAHLTQVNSTLLPATFVLRLNKPLPVCSATLYALFPSAVVGGDNATSSGATSREPPTTIMNLIVETSSGQQHLKDSTKRSFVRLQDQTHCYFFTDNKYLKATLVSYVPFTEPSQVPIILAFLKKQALLYSLLSSCVRPQSNIGNDMDTTTILEVHAISFQQISVSVQHSFEESMATVDFNLNESNVSCNIPTSTRNCDLISTKLTNIVQKSLSIPITMRALLKFWEQERIKIYQSSVGSGVTTINAESGGNVDNNNGQVNSLKTKKDFHENSKSAKQSPTVPQMLPEEASSLGQIINDQQQQQTVDIATIVPDFDSTDKNKNIWTDKTTNIENSVSISSILHLVPAAATTCESSLELCASNMETQRSGVEVSLLTQNAAASIHKNNISLSNTTANATSASSSTTITTTPINSSVQLHSAPSNEEKYNAISFSSSATVTCYNSRLSKRSFVNTESTTEGTEQKKKKHSEKKCDDSHLGPPEKVFSCQNSPDTICNTLARKISFPSPLPKGLRGLLFAFTTVGTSFTMSPLLISKNCPFYTNSKYRSTAYNIPKSLFGKDLLKHGSSGKLSMSSLKSAAPSCSAAGAGGSVDTTGSIVNTALTPPTGIMGHPIACMSGDVRTASVKNAFVSATTAVAKISTCVRASVGGKTNTVASTLINIQLIETSSSNLNILSNCTSSLVSVRALNLVVAGAGGGNVGNNNEQTNSSYGHVSLAMGPKNPGGGSGVGSNNVIVAAKQDTKTKENFHENSKSTKQSPTVLQMLSEEASSLGQIINDQQQQQTVDIATIVADVDSTDKNKNIWTDKTTNIENSVSISSILHLVQAAATTCESSLELCASNMEIQRSGIETILLLTQNAAASIHKNNISLSNTTGNATSASSSTTITTTPINSSVQQHSAPRNEEKYNAISFSSSATVTCYNSRLSKRSFVNTASSAAATEQKKKKHNEKKCDDSHVGPPEKVFSSQNSPDSICNATPYTLARKFGFLSPLPKGSRGLLFASTTVGTSSTMSSLSSPKNFPFCTNSKHRSTAYYIPKSLFGMDLLKHGSSGKPSMSSLKSGATSFSPQADKTNSNLVAVGVGGVGSLGGAGGSVDTTGSIVNTASTPPTGVMGHPIACMSGDVRTASVKNAFVSATTAVANISTCVRASVGGKTNTVASTLINIQLIETSSSNLNILSNCTSSLVSVRALNLVVAGAGGGNVGNNNEQTNSSYGRVSIAMGPKNPSGGSGVCSNNVIVAAKQDTKTKENCHENSKSTKQTPTATQMLSEEASSLGQIINDQQQQQQTADIATIVPDFDSTDKNKNIWTDKTTNIENSVSTSSILHLVPAAATTCESSLELCASNMETQRSGVEVSLLTQNAAASIHKNNISLSNTTGNATSASSSTTITTTPINSSVQQHSAPRNEEKYNAISFSSSATVTCYNSRLSKRSFVNTASSAVATEQKKKKHSEKKCDDSHVEPPEKAFSSQNSPDSICNAGPDTLERNFTSPSASPKGSSDGMLASTRVGTISTMSSLPSPVNSPFYTKSKHRSPKSLFGKDLLKHGSSGKRNMSTLKSAAASFSPQADKTNSNLVAVGVGSVGGVGSLGGAGGSVDTTGSIVNTASTPPNGVMGHPIACMSGDVRTASVKNAFVSATTAVANISTCVRASVGGKTNTVASSLINIQLIETSSSNLNILSNCTSSLVSVRALNLVVAGAGGGNVGNNNEQTNSSYGRVSIAMGPKNPGGGSGVGSNNVIVAAKQDTKTKENCHENSKSTKQTPTATQMLSEEASSLGQIINDQQQQQQTADIATIVPDFDSTDKNKNIWTDKTTNIENSVSTSSILHLVPAAATTCESSLELCASNMETQRSGVEVSLLTQNAAASIHKNNISLSNTTGNATSASSSTTITTTPINSSVQQHSAPRNEEKYAISFSSSATVTCYNSRLSKRSFVNTASSAAATEQKKKKHSEKKCDDSHVEPPEKAFSSQNSPDSICNAGPDTLERNFTSPSASPKGSSDGMLASTRVGTISTMSSLPSPVNSPFYTKSKHRSPKSLFGKDLLKHGSSGKRNMSTLKSAAASFSPQADKTNSNLVAVGVGSVGGVGSLGGAGGSVDTTGSIVNTASTPPNGVMGHPIACMSGDVRTASVKNAFVSATTAVANISTCVRASVGGKTNTVASSLINIQLIETSSSNLNILSNCTSSLVSVGALNAVVAGAGGGNVGNNNEQTNSSYGHVSLAMGPKNPGGGSGVGSNNVIVAAKQDTKTKENCHENSKSTKQTPTATQMLSEEASSLGQIINDQQQQQQTADIATIVPDFDSTDKNKNIWTDKTTNIENSVSTSSILHLVPAAATTCESSLELCASNMETQRSGVEVSLLTQNAAASIHKNNISLSNTTGNATSASSSTTITTTPINSSVQQHSAPRNEEKYAISFSSSATVTCYNSRLSKRSFVNTASSAAATEQKKKKHSEKKCDDSHVEPPEKAFSSQNSPDSICNAGPDTLERNFTSPSASPKGSSDGMLASTRVGTISTMSSLSSPVNSPFYTKSKHRSPKSLFGKDLLKHGSSGKPNMSTLKSAAASFSPQADKTNSNLVAVGVGSVGGVGSLGGAGGSVDTTGSIVNTASTPPTGVMGHPIACMSGDVRTASVKNAFVSATTAVANISTCVRASVGGKTNTVAPSSKNIQLIETSPSNLNILSVSRNSFGSVGACNVVVDGIGSGGGTVEVERGTAVVSAPTLNKVSRKSTVSSAHGNKKFAEYRVKQSQEGLKLIFSRISSESNSFKSIASNETMPSNVGSNAGTIINAFNQPPNKKQHTGLKLDAKNESASSRKSKSVSQQTSQNTKNLLQKSYSSDNLSSNLLSHVTPASITVRGSSSSNSNNHPDLYQKLRKKNKESRKGKIKKSLERDRERDSALSSSSSQPAKCSDMKNILELATPTMAANMKGFMKNNNTKFKIPKLSQRAGTTNVTTATTNSTAVTVKATSAPTTSTNVPSSPTTTLDTITMLQQQEQIIQHHQNQQQLQQQHLLQMTYPLPQPYHAAIAAFVTSKAGTIDMRHKRCPKYSCESGN